MPDVRRRFLDERREICRERFDTLHAPVYDARWGSYLNPTHEQCVRAVVAQLVEGARLLDAACGTGKYWPILLRAGLSIVGADQSRAMLEVAFSKHPEVPMHLVALQDLAASDLREFDALLCVDAMENVGPEDWPGVVAGLRRCLRAGGTAYLTVELPEPGDVGQPDTSDAPLRRGETLSDGAYHYYPEVDDAVTLLSEAGFRVDRVLEGDGYAHFLLTGV